MTAICLQCVTVVDTRTAGSAFLQTAPPSLAVSARVFARQPNPVDPQLAFQQAVSGPLSRVFCLSSIRRWVQPAAVMRQFPNVSTDMSPAGGVLLFDESRLFSRARTAKLPSSVAPLLPAPVGRLQLNWGRSSDAYHPSLDRAGAPISIVSFCYLFTFPQLISRAALSVRT